MSAAQVCQRIRSLVRQYVTPNHLHERLQDLPAQFARPQPRPWPIIAWSAVQPDQVKGIDLKTFCQVLSGTIDTEAPIRNYTQASRQYLAPFYADMARFVGGTAGPDGTLISPGLWEIEEKRHTPALLRLHTQLSGQRLTPTPHSARPYTPSADLRTDLYRHGLHRIATEYGAACLYLWLMAHSTGTLQQVLGELLVDEINHMTNFWGFGVWAYPDVSLGKNLSVLSQAVVQKMCDRTLQGSLFHTLRRMIGVLAWEQWSLTNRMTCLYTFDQVMRVLWRWHHDLTPSYLNDLFGQNSYAP
ncbi:MAG: ferritin-like domain-containing protein [Cyanobacteria bacterium Co-bin13]|nr:ferritin-like domain-containing protein [Cyanobacteria bacterium Co-bin13]